MRVFQKTHAHRHTQTHIRTLRIAMAWSRVNCAPSGMSSRNCMDMRLPGAARLDREPAGMCASVRVCLYVHVYERMCCHSRVVGQL